MRMVIFECLVLIGELFWETRKSGLLGGDVSLGVVFEVSLSLYLMSVDQT